MAHYQVGQKVVISVHRNGRAPDLYDGEVSKIGRRWITVKREIAPGYHCENRFDVDNGHGDQDFGYPPQLWSSRELYEAHVERTRLWKEVSSLVRESNRPPTHLSTEDISVMLRSLQGGSN